MTTNVFIEKLTEIGKQAAEFLYVLVIHTTLFIVKIVYGMPNHSEDCEEYQSDARIDGKTVVITGGNSGLGKAAARDLYKRGGRVIILCRDQQKTKHVIQEIKNEIEQLNKNHDICAKFIDLADLSSVRKCAQEILEEEKQIHILINNAAVFLSEEKLSVDGFEIHFSVNYLGHFLLTLLLLPRLIQSGPARIVNVATIGHKLPIVSRRLNMNSFQEGKSWIWKFKAYCQSKLAFVLFSKELARKLKDAGINNVTTYSLYPGLSITDIGKNLDLIFWGLTAIWQKWSQWFWQSPQKGAKTILYCALDEKISQQSGLYYKNCKEDRTNPLVEDQILAETLWNISTEFVKLSNYNPFQLSK